MTVIGATLLLPVGRALARIHVEHDGLRRSPARPPTTQRIAGSRLSLSASFTSS